jgi:hypothetical protein
LLLAWRGRMIRGHAGWPASPLPSDLAGVAASPEVLLIPHSVADWISGFSWAAYRTYMGEPRGNTPILSKPNGRAFLKNKALKSSWTLADKHLPQSPFTGQFF